MAERRMFAKTIIDSDAFLDMPLSTQALYFHLSMRADDEGFVNNPKKIQKILGASDDDAKILLAKKFIISFESGVIVIKHWKIHNYIQKDRLKKTNYKEERGLLTIDDNNGYTLDTKCVQIGDIGKDRLGKISIEENRYIVEIISYLNEKSGKKFKSTSTNCKKHIQARLNEGYVVDDFKIVIDKKIKQWGNDTKMSTFIRPETLFGTKFDSYLNEIVAKSSFDLSNKQYDNEKVF